MEVLIKSLIGRHQGTPAIIICHGGSLDRYVSRAKDIVAGRIAFVCNFWFRYIDINPDYWFFTNPCIPIPLMGTIINSYNDKKQTHVLYADSVDLTDLKEVHERLKNVPYTRFDQRHFEGKRCDTPVNYAGDHRTCCDHFEEGRLTIQEELMNHTGHNEHYSPGDTVGLHMISSAILMGCNPVYILGMDLNYRTGYPKSLPNVNCEGLSEGVLSLPDGRTFDDCQDRLKKDLDIIMKSASMAGVSVVFNPESL